MAERRLLRIGWWRFETEDLDEVEQGMRNLGQPQGRAEFMLDDLKGRRSAMRVRELVEILHLSEREIYKLAASNQIPHFKIGSSVRFDAAAVLVWLKDKAIASSVRRPSSSVRPLPERMSKIARGLPEGTP